VSDLFAVGAIKKALDSQKNPGSEAKKENKQAEITKPKR
jgi:hypothetical protein